MKRFNYVVVLICLLISFSWIDSASAAVTTQTITLRPGWNAVFLEVEPESTAPADVFAGIIGLESVWRWNPRTSTVEFIQDPDTFAPEEPQWMVYYPNTSQNALLTNLYAIHGETPYLVNIASGAPDPQFLNVLGEPTIPRIDWKANSFNFVGFHLTENNPPNFGNFFSSSLAHDGQEIYILTSSGEWQKVENPSVTSMQKNEAFWIYCKGSSEFTGPMSIQLEQGTALNYGSTLLEQDLKILNNSNANKDAISVSAGPFTPSGSPLYYWKFDQANNEAGWEPFPLQNNLTVPAGDFQNLRIGVKRAGLTAGVEYVSNLTITDGEGMIIIVPVSVTGISYAGLWVGNATIKKVSEPANVVDPITPVKTGSEFSFRIILHGEEAGAVRLLSQVIQVWQEGTWKPDPNDLGKLIVDEPGYFVLIANDALVPDYSGAAMRDGQLVGRRISAPAFPSLTAAQGLMTNEGINPSPGNALSLTITLSPDDPTNPFRHKYHPDHKNPDQSYNVDRAITMTFADEYEGKPITGVPSLSWGSSEIGGIYRETISGLHKNEINMEGIFLLHKVSNVTQLLF